MSLATIRKLIEFGENLKIENFWEIPSNFFLLRNT